MTALEWDRDKLTEHGRTMWPDPAAVVAMGDDGSRVYGASVVWMHERDEGHARTPAAATPAVRVEVCAMGADAAEAVIGVETDGPCRVVLYVNGRRVEVEA